MMNCSYYTDGVISTYSDGQLVINICIARLSEINMYYLLCAQASLFV